VCSKSGASFCSSVDDIHNCLCLSGEMVQNSKDQNVNAMSWSLT
jgi:hypothetical protein